MRIIGGSRPSVVYVPLSEQRTISSTVTFNVDMGADGSRRFLVFQLAMLGLSTLTSVKVNGSVVTVISAVAQFYGVLLPTGSTATITVTNSGSGVTVYSILGWQVRGVNSIVPTDDATSTASPGVVSVDVRNRGIVLASAYANTGATYTWTGVTSDFSNTSGTNNIPRSGASIAVTSPGNPRTVSVSYGGSPAARVAYAISLR